MQNNNINNIVNNDILQKIQEMREVAYMLERNYINVTNINVTNIKELQDYYKHGIAHAKNVLQSNSSVFKAIQERMKLINQVLNHNPGIQLGPQIPALMNLWNNFSKEYIEFRYKISNKKQQCIKAYEKAEEDYRKNVSEFCLKHNNFDDAKAEEDFWKNNAFKFDSFCNIMNSIQDSSIKEDDKEENSKDD